MLDLVFLIHQHDYRLVVAQFPLVQIDIGADDHQVPRSGQVGGRAIDLNLARFTIDHIGGKTGSIADVVDINLLEFQQAGLCAEGTVDGNRPLVVQVGGGHRCAVNF